MQDSTPFSDETLTAYLDGEVDATTQAAIRAALAQDEALAARLATLDIPLGAIRQVMAPAVLRAPGMPEALAAHPQAASNKRRGRFLTPLALAASFAVGMVATTLLIPAPADPQIGGWTEAVASYQALYVTETLSGGRQEAAALDGVMARARDEFAVSLRPATTLAGLDFRRAQMLGFEGKPLLQMAYLTPEGTPIALCLIRTDTEDRNPEPSLMFGQAGTSWVADGVGYFLIGGDNMQRIETLGAEVRALL